VQHSAALARRSPKNTSESSAAERFARRPADRVEASLRRKPREGARDGVLERHRARQRPVAGVLVIARNLTVLAELAVHVPRDAESPQGDPGL
jgi:hypothetical protein